MSLSPSLVPYSRNSLQETLRTSAKNLISGLLEKDPTKRLTAEQMLEHEWMVTPHPPPSETGSRDTESSFPPFPQNRTSEIFIHSINKYPLPAFLSIHHVDR